MKSNEEEEIKKIIKLTIMYYRLAFHIRALRASKKSEPVYGSEPIWITLFFPVYGLHIKYGQANNYAGELNNRIQTSKQSYPNWHKTAS